MQPKTQRQQLEEIALDIKAWRFVRQISEFCWGVWVNNYLKQFYRSSKPQDACLNSPFKGENEMVINRMLPQDYVIKNNPWHIANTKVTEIKERFKNLPVSVKPTNEDLFESALHELSSIFPKYMTKTYENAIRWAIQMQEEVLNANRH